LSEQASEQHSPISESQRPIEALAGLAAATAIFLSVMMALNIDLSVAGTNIDFAPVRVGVAAEILALLAAWVGGRHARLATFAVFFTAVCWVIAMSIAVVFENPIF
jgi:uncharacterized PurR-regulated membrane protein YhhQ (DUF165 family)